MFPPAFDAEPANGVAIKRIQVFSCAALALLLACLCPRAASAQQQEPPATVASADDAPVEQAVKRAQTAKRSSPWLLVPLVSNSPKLGTSFGLLGAYLRTFDPDSRVSVFGQN